MGIPMESCHNCTGWDLNCSSILSNALKSGKREKKWDDIYVVT